MKSELLIVVATWLFFELFFLFNSYRDFVHPYIAVMLDLGRNYIIATVSGLLPLYRSFSFYKLPTYTTKEFAADFSLLMINEKSYLAFCEYLKTNVKSGYNYLCFYTEVNVFKHQNTDGITNMIATDIHNRYLNDLEFPEELIVKLQNNYKSCEKNKYDYAFDALCDYAFAKLRDEDFVKFKSSSEYKKLEVDLGKEESIYSRLISSSMIMNSI
jgi:hypothetical protein